MSYNKQTNTKKINIILSLSFLLIVGITFFFRCYERVQMRDELLYEYVWEENDDKTLWEQGHRFDRRISSLDDIIQTQTIHYHEVNGRSIVHGIEQFFSGIAGYTTWSICNSIVFLALILLIGVYLTVNLKLQFLLFLVVVVLALLYLFPEPSFLWTSNNYAMNYLWPSAMAMGIFCLWRRLETQIKPVKTREGILIALLSFIFGWSHEGFSVGFTGGLVLYFFLNNKCFNKNILWIAIPLLFGSLIMCVAPGNIHRFMGDDGSGANSGGIIGKLFNGLNNLFYLKFFWLLIVVLLCKVITNRKAFVKWLLSNNVMRVSCVLVIALCFSMFANTAPYSFTFTELLSFVLLLSLLSRTYLFSNKSKIVFWVAVFMGLLVVVHQTMIINDQFRLTKYQRQIINNYISSKNGIIEFETPKFSKLTNPYLLKFQPDEYITGLKLVYGKNKSYEFLLSSADFEVINNPKEYWNSKRRVFLGTAKAQNNEGSRYYWLNPQVFSKIDSVTFVYDAHELDSETAPITRLFNLLYPMNSSERIKVNKIVADEDTIYYVLHPQKFKPKGKILRRIDL